MQDVVTFNVFWRVMISALSRRSPKANAEGILATSAYAPS
jgi:hypothetical protein